MKKQMICTVCPKGCAMDIETDGGSILSIEGYRCSRGLSYATSEVMNPVRILTTTRRVRGGNLPLISVKSSLPIPKGLMTACIKQINETEIEAPVAIGQKLITHIFHTGADIVATRNVPLSER